MDTSIDLTEIIIALITGAIAFFSGKKVGIRSVFRSSEKIIEDNGQLLFNKYLTRTRSGELGIRNLFSVMDFVTDLILVIQKIKNAKTVNVLSALWEIKPLLPGIINLWKYGKDILAEIKDLKPDEYLKLVEYGIEKGNGITKEKIETTLQSFGMLRNL